MDFLKKYGFLLFVLLILIPFIIYVPEIIEEGEWVGLTIFSVVGIAALVGSIIHIKNN